MTRTYILIVLQEKP